MKKQFLWKPLGLFLMICTLFLNACDTKDAGEKSNDSIANTETEDKKAFDFLEHVFEERLAESPEFQTNLGRKTNYDQWDDVSVTAADKSLEMYKHQLEEFDKQIDESKLSKQMQLSARLFKDATNRSIERSKYRDYSYPVNQMFGFHSQTPTFLINYHKIDSVADAKAYIKRIEGVKPLFAEQIKNLERRKEKGILLPKFLFWRVIESSENVINGQPFDNSENESAILKDFKGKVGKLDITDNEKNALIKEASEALNNFLKPAYLDLVATLKEHEKVATDDAGVWKFPDGDNFYKLALANTTTTSLTAEEIHEIGLKEVARIHGEMMEIAKKVGFEGDLQGFFKKMREDKSFVLPNTDEGRTQYLDSNKVVINNMKAYLPNLFNVMPKADLIVKKVEAFREKSAGKAFYNNPSLDGKRPGIYYANLYKMEEMPLYEMEALAYHEGIPGHHMQIAIKQELEGVPTLQKFSRYTAYSEGWGLYSELLPKEHGFYTNPYSDFGRLTMEIWRACRLVVDTGIHAKKWDREKGIAYYKENTPAQEGACVKMVERHMVLPSQATAYKIGMLKILELREKAKAALGDKFDIRDYHDVVLKQGAVPLNILEELVDEYIESK